MTHIVAKTTLIISLSVGLSGCAQIGSLFKAQVQPIFEICGKFCNETRRQFAAFGS